tara:strand:+ start:517 stop:663 length:147 start_codon:yes stop_codon:yes gene_type:complete
MVNILPTYSHYMSASGEIVVDFCMPFRVHIPWKAYLLKKKFDSFCFAL